MGDTQLVCCELNYCWSVCVIGEFKLLPFNFVPKSLIDFLKYGAISFYLWCRLTIEMHICSFVDSISVVDKKKFKFSIWKEKLTFLILKNFPN